MKSSNWLRLWVLLLFSAGCGAARAQSGYAIVESGADYNLLQKTTVENGTNRVHQYTQLATGLNYTNSSGQWLPSCPQISLLPDGSATATQGEHTVQFPADIYNGVLHVTTPDGRDLYSRPLCVCLDDGSNTVVIATLTNSVGTLTASNEITYPNCFAGITADLVCDYLRSGFECSLVLRAQPPSPEQLGLVAPDTTMELVTEFFNTPEPRQIPGACNDWYGLQDYTLKFGRLTMTRGKAFGFSNSSTNGGSPPAPVYKSWTHSDNGDFLTEQVPLAYVTNALAALPLSASLAKPPASVTHLASVHRVLPPGHGLIAGTNRILIASAVLPKQPGVVLDYNEIDCDLTNVTFCSGQTYEIVGTCNLSGLTTFEGGAIIKYTNDSSLVLDMTSTAPDGNLAAVWPASVDQPAMFTSADDNSVGEPIGTGTPLPNNAAYFSYAWMPPGTADVWYWKNIVVQYADCVAEDNAGRESPSLIVSDAQFLHCNAVFVTYASTLLLDNDLFSGCSMVVVSENGTWVGGTDLTIDQCGTFSCDPFLNSLEIELTNCLVTSVTNFATAPTMGGFSTELWLQNCLVAGGTNTFDALTNTFPFNYTVPACLSGIFGIPIYGHGTEVRSCLDSTLQTNLAGVYESAAAANYYLAASSPYRGLGTTNIDPNVLAQIETLTTYAPQDGGWPDTNGTDLGYHYSTNEDSTFDGIPDWWIWQNFGSYAYGATNVDSSGNTFLYDYTHNLDPNIIQFTFAFTNFYVNTQTVPVQLQISGGVPSYVAVLVNDTNTADAVWESYVSSNFVATLGSTNGNYFVYVGLKGYSSTATPTWSFAGVTLYANLPQLTVTNLTGSTVYQSSVQLQGYASQALNSMTFDVSNATGIFANQPGYLTGQFYDTNLLAYTTNYFESSGMDLASGTNLVTLHATDWAGNTTNMVLTLNYVPNTNAPALNLIWPQPGTPISGSNFTLQAQVSDPTATVTASLNGNTTPGLIEANGTVWVQNLVLNPGTNCVTLTASNVFGNLSVTNFAVVDNDVGLMIDPLSSGELNQASVTVTGSIGDPTDNTVYINGVEATNLDDAGDWEATNVPVSPTGTATLNVQVYTGDPTLTAEKTVNVPQPPMVVLAGYSGFFNDYNVSSGSGPGPQLDVQTANWAYDSGGSYTDSGYSPTASNSGERPYDYNFSVAPDGPGFAPSEFGLGYILTVTWDYFSVNVSGDWGFFQRFSQAQPMIAASGMQQAGTTNVYLVYVNGSTFSDPVVTFGEGSGDVPVTTPETMRLNGQPIWNTGVTNSDGSVSGVAVVFGKAGKNLPLTLTNTPNAIAYNMQSSNLTLHIFDINGMDLTLQTNTVIVGQQMNLACQLAITNSFMTNFVLTNFQWTVPGCTVKQSLQYFSYGSNGLAITYETNTVLQNADLQTNNIKFYWIDAGTNLEVDCTATVQGVPVNGKAFFDVLRPSSTFMAITTTKVPPVNTNTEDGLFLQYGVPANTAGSDGIFFTFSIAAPTNGAGSFGLLQVINSTLRQYISDTGLAEKRAGTNVLDHEPFTLLTIEQTTPVGDAGTSSASFGDSPADHLRSSRLWVSANDSFTSYLLYRPAGNTNQTIWVTLRKIGWSWSGAATNVAGSWMLESGYPTPPVNPTSTNTSELPTWYGDFLGLPVVPNN